MSALYDEDFYSWTREQADLLRRAGEQRLNTPSGLDWEHLALAVMGARLVAELQLYNRYVVLIAHLLKWHYQPVCGRWLARHRQRAAPPDRATAAEESGA